jgi:hypothetical protein
MVYLTEKYLQQNQKENGTGQRGHDGGPVVGQPSRATAHECAVGSRGAAQHGPVRRGLPARKCTHARIAGCRLRPGETAPPRWPRRSERLRKGAHRGRLGRRRRCAGGCSGVAVRPGVLRRTGASASAARGEDGVARLQGRPPGVGEVVTRRRCRRLSAVHGT